VHIQGKSFLSPTFFLQNGKGIVTSLQHWQQPSFARDLVACAVHCASGEPTRERKGKVYVQPLPKAYT